MERCCHTYSCDICFKNHETSYAPRELFNICRIITQYMNARSSAGRLQWPPSAPFYLYRRRGAGRHIAPAQRAGALAPLRHIYQARVRCRGRRYIRIHTAFVVARSMMSKSARSSRAKRTTNNDICRILPAHNKCSFKCRDVRRRICLHRGVRGEYA